MGAAGGTSSGAGAASPAEAEGAEEAAATLTEAAVTAGTLESESFDGVIYDS